MTSIFPSPNLQPTHLANDILKLLPLRSEHFETLYQIASDPLIWEQHPIKNRYQRDVFEKFLTGATESKGAFIIIDAKTNEVIGSCRYYDFDAKNQSLKIGYTFLVRHCWGSKFNPALKVIMLNYAFTFVDTVTFQVGANNIRSQKAMEKLGAIKIGEEDIAYFGEEQATKNFIYRINKFDWVKFSFAIE